MKKTMMVLALVALSTVVLFGAGVKEAKEADSGVTTIRWAYWGSGQRVQISQQAIDIYQSRHPNIRVSPEVSRAGDHFVVDTQLAGFNGPDIIGSAETS